MLTLKDRQGNAQYIIHDDGTVTKVTILEDKEEPKAQGTDE